MCPEACLPGTFSRSVYGLRKDAHTIDKIKPGRGRPDCRTPPIENLSRRMGTSRKQGWWVFRLEVKGGPYYLAYGSPNFKGTS